MWKGCNMNCNRILLQPLLCATNCKMAASRLFFSPSINTHFWLLLLHTPSPLHHKQIPQVQQPCFTSLVFFTRHLCCLNCAVKYLKVTTMSGYVPIFVFALGLCVVISKGFEKRAASRSDRCFDVEQRYHIFNHQLQCHFFFLWVASVCGFSGTAKRETGSFFFVIDMPFSFSLFVPRLCISTAGSQRTLFISSGYYC